MGSVVRRYRVKYAVYEEEGGAYQLKYKELRSLREAADFILTVLDDPHQEFSEIRVLTYGTLSESELSMLTFLTDGRVK